MRPELLGALGSELFDENDVQEFSSITVGRTSAGQVRLSSSLAKPNEGTDSHGLSIDADFFSEEKIRADINECADLLGRFNKEAGNLFRWCIKAPLYDALQPT